MNLLLHQALVLGGGGGGRVFNDESRWGFFGTELQLHKKVFKIHLVQIIISYYSWN